MEMGAVLKPQPSPSVDPEHFELDDRNIVLSLFDKLEYFINAIVRSIKHWI